MIISMKLSFMHSFIEIKISVNNNIETLDNVKSYADVLKEKNLLLLNQK